MSVNQLGSQSGGIVLSVNSFIPSIKVAWPESYFDYMTSLVGPNGATCERTQKTLEFGTSGENQYLTIGSSYRGFDSENIYHTINIYNLYIY